jgi:hypothetical protein
MTPVKAVTAEGQHGTVHSNGWTPDGPWMDTGLDGHWMDAGWTLDDDLMMFRSEWMVIESLSH